MQTASFQDQFFTRSMNQQFNSLVDDDSEPQIRKWLRATNQL
jgi:hypothetical protein